MYSVQIKILIGDKIEHHHLPDRSCNYRLGGVYTHARPLEPADQHHCGHPGRIPGGLLPQPHLQGWDDQRCHYHSNHAIDTAGRWQWRPRFETLAALNTEYRIKNIF
jgi:hypothetical protein